jgi:hypothetical protein
MAQDALVELKIEGGLELINSVRGIVPVDVAWWASVLPEKESPAGEGNAQFYLASSMVDKEGAAIVYHRLYDALLGTAQGDSILSRVGPGKIKVVGLKSRVMSDILKIINLYEGPPPIYVARCRLGEFEAADVHIIYVTKLPSPPGDRWSSSPP